MKITVMTFESETASLFVLSLFLRLDSVETCTSKAFSRVGLILYKVVGFLPSTL